MSPNDIISGFECRGLFPVDRNKFPETDFNPKELKKYKMYKSLSEEVQKTSQNLSQDAIKNITEPHPHTPLQVIQLK